MRCGIYECEWVVCFGDVLVVPNEDETFTSDWLMPLNQKKAGGKSFSITSKKRPWWILGSLSIEIEAFVFSS